MGKQASHARSTAHAGSVATPSFPGVPAVLLAAPLGPPSVGHEQWLTLAWR
jgi:hypothetical protein